MTFYEHKSTWSSSDAESILFGIVVPVRIFPLSADREILNLYLSCVGNLFSQLGTKKEREAGKWSEDYAGRPILKWCGIVRGMCVISVL